MNTVAATPPLSRVPWTDVAAIVCLAVLGAAFSLHAFQQIGPQLVPYTSYDIWFDADTPRAFDNMTSRNGGSHYRTAVHPIASILISPVVKAISLAFGLSLAAAMAVFLACIAAATLAVFFSFLRVLGLPVVAAFAFCLLYGSSAAFLYWSGIPELYSPAALTIVLVLLLLARGRSVHWIWWVLGSAGSLSITVTNWMFGGIASFFAWDFRTFVRINAVALGLVMILSGVQYVTYHDARLFFLPGSVKAEVHWTQVRMEDRGDAVWTPMANIRSMLVTTIVTPTPVQEVKQNGKGSRITNQFDTQFAPEKPVTLAASALWCILLSAGFWGALRMPRRNVVGATLLTCLTGQLVLHSVYGYPTFLYAMHLLPLLVGLAACSWFVLPKRLVLALALGTAALAGISNAPNLAANFELGRLIAEQQQAAAAE